DHLLAARFAALQSGFPRDRPLFALWMSTTTHIPFRLPPGHGPDPVDPSARYARALAYLDFAVGEVLRAIRTGPRARPTVVVVVGDHAIPNRPLYRNMDRDGVPSPGQIWTSLWMAGPGIPRGEVRERPVSQVDLAPTLLSLLDIRAS